MVEIHTYVGINLYFFKFRLDSSGSASQTLISLGGIACHGTKVYVFVETTAPLPKQEQKTDRTKTHGAYKKY